MRSQRTYFNMNSLLILVGVTYLTVVVATGTSLSLRHRSVKNNNNNINTKRVRETKDKNGVFAQSFVQTNENVGMKGSNPGFLMPNVPHKRIREPFKIDDSNNIPAHKKTLDLENFDVSQFTKSDFGPADANQRQNFDWIKYRVAAPEVLKLP
eukprot:g4153.t1